jgi:exopolyphosphatase/guanosine-5'-triphosphate,3'-diphosphate pyrophosphatase
MSIHRFAIIDCGTNTFHLLICEQEGQTIYPYFRDKVHVKIGEGGIGEGYITDQAFDRAIRALEYFKMAIDKFEAEQVIATATSAIRNARNGQYLVNTIFERTGIQVQIISGNKEAELIYKGVALAHKIGPEPTLIVDIGGGSVEFIIADTYGPQWLRSYEIGAQRLLDQFHHQDPMSKRDSKELYAFLEKQLKDLIQVSKDLKVVTMVGSSGSFDTLYEMHARKKKIQISSEETSFHLPLKGFRTQHEKLITKDKEQRLNIPGMAEARVDMIVVASCLIDFLLNELSIERLVVSTFALKEGIMSDLSKGVTTFAESTT